MPSIRIGGRLIKYDPKDRRAIRHLMEDLGPNERKVFLDQARMKGSAAFEIDEPDADYEIAREADGTYELRKRE